LLFLHPYTQPHATQKTDGELNEMMCIRHFHARIDAQPQLRCRTATLGCGGTRADNYPPLFLRGSIIPWRLMGHGRDAGRTRGAPRAAPLNQSRQSWSPDSLFMETLASVLRVARLDALVIRNRWIPCELLPHPTGVLAVASLTPNLAEDFATKSPKEWAHVEVVACVPTCSVL
jgi:hypothetical protein